MKKIAVLLFVVLLSGCHVTAGDFKENRNRIHDMGQDDAYCEANPDRCVHNVPW
jgi:hypothetical protein